MIDEANQLLLSLIIKNPKDYLRFIIRPKIQGDNDNTYVFEPFGRQYFGNMITLEKFLIDLKEHRIAQQALLFLNKNGDQVFEQFISSSIPLNLQKNEKGQLEFIPVEKL